MAQIKIASFNVENLFGRAKVLNFYDHDDAAEKLEKIAELEHELSQNHYNKPLIIDLYKQVKDYVKFNVMRKAPHVSHLVVYHRSSDDQWIVSPDGRDDWFGFIEFKRESFGDDAQKSTARVVREMNADILCIIEVENRLMLKTFNSERLYGLYPYNMLIDGNDQRGIDVGLYSKLELGRVRTNIFDGTSLSRTFSRDCLEVEVKTDGGDSIFLLVNHLKSKWGGNQAESDQRRERQARRVAEILDQRYDLENQFVVVAGDLNDTPNSQPLTHLTQKPNLHDVLKLQYPNEPDKRWTYHYVSNEQIDYILVSDKLEGCFDEAGVWRRGIANVDQYSNGEVMPYNTVTSWRNAASDHGAVWATFDI